MCKKLSPSDCSSGQVTKDSCGCCDRCAKAEGESCAGEWGFSGTCAEGLTCVKPPPVNPNFPDLNFHVEGTCCCPKKTLVETGEVFILDDSTGMKALDICLYNCVYRKEGDSRNDPYCFKQGNSQVECN